MTNGFRPPVGVARPDAAWDKSILRSSREGVAAKNLSEREFANSFATKRLRTTGLCWSPLLTSTNLDASVAFPVVSQHSFKRTTSHTRKSCINVSSSARAAPVDSAGSSSAVMATQNFSGACLSRPSVSSQIAPASSSSSWRPASIATVDRRVLPASPPTWKPIPIASARQMGLPLSPALGLYAPQHRLAQLPGVPRSVLGHDARRLPRMFLGLY